VNALDIVCREIDAQKEVVADQAFLFQLLLFYASL
jgi:hypothetical protein